MGGSEGPAALQSRPVSLAGRFPVRRVLRSPRVIVALVLAIAFAGLVHTVVPQATDQATHARLGESFPGFALIARVLQLDRVLHSFWFAGLVLLAAACLVSLQVDQWRRLARTWRSAPLPARLAAAPFRREILPVAPGAPSARTRILCRPGLLGSPLFHLGLLVLVLAGLGRVVLGGDAQIDVVEGQTIEAHTGAFGAEWRGLLAPPLSLAAPILFESVMPDRYDSGSLRALRASIRIGEAPQAQELAINSPASLGSTRIYLSPAHGLAALFETEVNGKVERRAVLMSPINAAGREQGWHVLVQGAQLYVSAAPGALGELPASAELRVVRSGALLFAGTLGQGAEIHLPSGERVSFLGLRRWVRVDASRDPALPLAYAGFALVILGATLFVGFIPADFGVLVDAGGHRMVALRPHRLAPVFAERFERLAARAQEGGKV